MHNYIIILSNVICNYMHVVMFKDAVQVRLHLTNITFCDTQLCGRCLVHMTPVVKVVIHCVLQFCTIISKIS